MSSQRLQHLINLLSENQINALAINPSPTLKYLTGLNFHIMERPVILLLAPPATAALIVPELELAKLSNSVIPLQSFAYNDNPATWGTAFQRACQFLQLDGLKIGVDPNRMRVLELRFLEAAAPKATFISAENLLSELRIQKEEQEIKNMRTAAKIAQDALLATLPMIKPGISERSIASELSIQLLRNGSDSNFPFAPNVSGGPHSADPHASPSDRPLENGDLLVIDWGATYQDYCSDITRTFAIGEIEPEFKRIYELVQAANEAGRAAGKPGLAAGKVDHVARNIITDGGYGQYFRHRVGHGLGMEAHETPYMFGENEFKLDVGMAYTVEPGIYLVGRGGVRIEDDMVVTANGSESLTDMPRNLQTLG